MIPRKDRNLQQGEQTMDYTIRFARIDDRDWIFALKSESIRPYVEKIWGWDENYQKSDFARDFSEIEQFRIIEMNGNCAGFIQCSFDDPYYEVVEIHLFEEYRGKGIGSDLLKNLKKFCVAQGKKVRIGCFKENRGAKRLYEKLGFIQTKETDTHYIMEYKK